jgi:ppGpp synthetase/RelA/SpoT-type nucleotidyltranferase
MSKQLANRLFELKEKINNSKAKRSELTGKLNHLKEQLKEEFETDSTEKAEEIIKEADELIEKLERKLNGTLVKAEEAFYVD